MTDTLKDSYPMPTEDENFASPSDLAEQELPPFQNITEDDIFAHNIDDALLQEAKNGIDYDENNLPEREYIPMPTIFEPIPEEAQKEILSKFALKKREKESSVIKTAQRLVNQFRALSAFRDDYVAEYNEELLNASEDVLSFLPTIIGGPAVREYLDYLLAHKQQGKVFDQDNIDFTITKKQGYLPSPDEDEIYTAPLRESGGQNISIDHTPLIQQTQILSDTLNSLKKSLSDQTAELKSAITLMGEAINRPIQVNTEGTLAVQPQESSEQIAKSVQIQREMLETAFEKMVTMQSDLFQKTVEELSKTVQAMQEQLRPTGVVRQALSSLKAAQQTTKEEQNIDSTQTDVKEKKSLKRQNKKEVAKLPIVETTQEKQLEPDSFVAQEEQNSNLVEEKEPLVSDEIKDETLSSLEKEAVETKETVDPFKPVSKTDVQEKPFSLLDELGISDEFDLYGTDKKNKTYSLLDELEDDEIEMLSEFDISKQD